MYDIERIIEGLTNKGSSELLSLCKTLMAESNVKEKQIEDLKSKVVTTKKQLEDPLVVKALTEIRTGEYGFWVEYKTKVDTALSYIHDKDTESKCNCFNELKKILEGNT